MRCSIDQINQLNETKFVALLGPVYEETPTVAKRAYAARPFADAAALHKAMVNAVEDMSHDEKMALIQAHPELGSRAKMAAASVREQSSTGLDQLNSQDYEQLQSLNGAYKEKFEFPFVMAVKGRTVGDILEAFQARLANDQDEEMARSLNEINQISRFRLDDLL